MVVVCVDVCYGVCSVELQQAAHSSHGCGVCYVCYGVCSVELQQAACSSHVRLLHHVPQSSHTLF